MKISWLNIPDRITFELKQLQEEGCNVSELCSEWEHLQQSGLNEDELVIKAESFYRKLEAVHSSTITDDGSSRLKELIVQYKKYPVPNPPEDLLYDRIYGGWLGRCAGCLLGKPVEKIPRSGIIELLSSNGNWPITDYITGQGIPGPLLEKYPWNKHSGKESLKENIECMAEDDDINYPIINLVAFERYGKHFSTEDVITTWKEFLPLMSSFTAERVAYSNFNDGIVPPETAKIRNPYREWIGAQIRADLWGWVSPANPAQAADFALRDARLTHVQNGIYGEVFFAAAIAASFENNSIEEIIHKALSFIPAESRFSEAVNYVLKLPILSQSWDKTVNLLYKKFGFYHWVHTINNAALVCAALISSQGDFEKAICNVVMGGWDTDSNGATVGSIIGTMTGGKGLPQKWTGPLKNRIRSSLKGFDNSLITVLAGRTLKAAENINNF